ncbi:adenosylcobinamide-GDP ribazoletransferase [Xanthomonas euvesicatoria]|uniref:adenosylcobinamide-GDP ribazoletransferase n=1 Tax=Xanthomonas euvesicatoria TaxID=456327 RepID=UPI0002266579|nr:adenosylcobinamide-GDP ribazoletransferase [Xanthomonas euvesicatoria]AEO43349.1 cobalamin synthase [Xanthomonas euvesicatoria pv. citrumelo F1]PPU89442.1 adenosylcobinamide-GDP ribazoletransferase [Xanthomonas euvesicatoria pv. citrumelonis]TKA20205.1 cobalamin synthase [Xanthomonas euvesicatoria pv. citrumelonis]
MIDGLLAALGFLTRMPVPARVFARPGAQARSLPWYPAVGLLIGAVVSALAWCLRDAAALLGAAMLLSSWVWFTGALHIDGLADTADAWVGGMGDRTRTLAIMRDPTSGPMAVTAIVLILLLKCTALAALLPTAPGGVWLAPLLARTALVAAFLTTPYVRAGGLGSGLVGSSRAGLLLSLLLGLACAFAVGRLRGMLACAVTGVVLVMWRRACLQRLGGMTGDTCGALVEISETAVLVALALQAS